MKKYNCRICGAGVYTADTTVESVLCAECERDEAMAKMRSPEEIMAEIIAQRVAMVAEDDAEYHLGWVEALEWVLGVDAELDSILVEEQFNKRECEFVEVVRCKDCKWSSHEADGGSAKTRCRLLRCEENEYCIWGERRVPK